MAMIMCSTHRWYRESVTPCISESGSQQLHISVIRGIDSSTFNGYAESSTPCIIDMESCQIPASVIRGVVDSVFCTRSSYLKKKNQFCTDFQNFKWLNHAFKGPIWQKIGQWCSWMLHPLNKASLGYCAPDQCVPTLDCIRHGLHNA